MLSQPKFENQPAELDKPGSRLHQPYSGSSGAMLVQRSSPSQVSASINEIDSAIHLTTKMLHANVFPEAKVGSAATRYTSTDQQNNMLNYKSERVDAKKIPDVVSGVQSTRQAAR